MKYILVFLLLNFNNVQGISQSDTCLNSLELGISFPPVGNITERTFTQTHLNVLGVNNIRFAEHWELREPTQGNFNWTGLDDRINWAFNNNLDFKFYIDSLLQRYSGKIGKIQFGNEWQDLFWYAGNAGDFIAANNILYNSVQAYSPSTKVVLGGFTTMSLRFAAGCNGYVNSVKDDFGNVYDATYFAANCNTPPFLAVIDRIDSIVSYSQFDIYDLHLYDDMEQWDEYYANFTDTISRPVIVSEFSGPNMNYEPYTENYQANRVFEYIKKIDSLQITEAYFFKLIEGGANPAHSKSGLLDSISYSEKEAYYIFGAFQPCALKNEELSIEMKETLSVYPNPGDGIFNVQYSKDFNRFEKGYVYDVLGRLVESFSLNENHLSIIDMRG